ncbi:MAG: PIN domain-containing protein [Candidatus Peribacteraceae bacterium]|nr:PIN domain-containing protein [Candidatus Peribacteraceae bacterium]
MPDILIDTNIVIYLFKKEKKYIDFMESGEKNAGISIVTYMETLIGAQNEREEQTIRAFLDQFEVIPLDIDIARQAAAWIRLKKQKGMRHPGTSDTIIGHTALFLGVPLVTNNRKDFAAFTGLKITVP